MKGKSNNDTTVFFPNVEWKLSKTKVERKNDQKPLQILNCCGFVGADIEQKRSVRCLSSGGQNGDIVTVHLFPFVCVCDDGVMICC